MSDNIIYEIAQLVENKEGMRTDVQEAFTGVQNVLREKYINKIYKAVETHKHLSETNPTREIQLLKTMKLFSDESRQQQLDQCIQMMTTINTMQNMQNELSKVHPPMQAQYQAMSETIHEDGVYEIDQACLQGNAPNSSPQLVSLLLLMALFQK